MSAWDFLKYLNLILQCKTDRLIFAQKQTFGPFAFIFNQKLLYLNFHVVRICVRWKLVPPQPNSARLYLSMSIFTLTPGYRDKGAPTSFKSCSDKTMPELMLVWIRVKYFCISKEIKEFVGLKKYQFYPVDFRLNELNFKVCRE